MEGTTEVYPSTPLRFVAFELKFRPTATAQSAALREWVYERVRESFPISEPAPTAGAEVVFGPQGPEMTQHSMGLRAIDRARTRGLAVTSQAFAVETSAYSHFAELRGWIEQGLRALESLDHVAAVERAGLRYIDEIRIEGVETPDQFAPYVNPGFHGPLDLLSDARATTTQGQTEFELGDRRRLMVRCGAMSGWAVDPRGPLQLRGGAIEGPFFLIDLDSYWTRPEGEYPEFSVGRVLELVDALHQPVREAFESAITDRLRDDLLRKETV